MKFLTLPVKLPYYPAMSATQTETRFGSLEISCPEIYESPLPNGKKIVRYDLLTALIPIWGSNCFIYRDNVYKIVSGSCKDDAEHYELFASYYRRYKDIRRYVNDLYYYGNREVPMVVRALAPIRTLLTEHQVEMFSKLKEWGGKHLVTTHEYLYFAFVPGMDLPNWEGIKVC